MGSDGVGQTLVTFWEGDISWMERLCLKAAVETGHTLRVYTYTPEKLAPLLPGAVLVDARTIIAQDTFTYQRVMPVARAYFADIFRLELLRAGAGVWVDFDVLMVKPMRLLNTAQDGYIFGLERPDLIGNSVLYMPAQSAMLADALKISYSFSKTAPWWTPTKKLKRYVTATAQQALAYVRGQPSPIFKKAFMGPHVVTHLAKKHGLLAAAQPMPVFYPVLQTQFEKYLDPKIDIERDVFTEKTLGAHLCHGSHPDLSRVPQAGFLADACARYGIR
jgi:hypothetical protein